MARAAVPDRPVPLQEMPRSRRDFSIAQLVLHLLIILRVDGGRLRAYGTVAYGAVTGRTKLSEALSLWPTLPYVFPVWSNAVSSPAPLTRPTLFTV